MKNTLLSLLVYLIIGASISSAALISYDILDIADFTDYRNTDTSATFSGTGFVGLYGSVSAYPGFGHLFGIENDDYSRTVLQVDASALLGSTINSAYLEFDLIDGESGSQNVTFSSFDANGALGYFWNVTALDSQVSVVNGLSSSSIDVTDMLIKRLSTNANWFGLHLQGTNLYHWSYTWTGYGEGPDSANVNLIVDHSPDPIPEPTTILLFGTGIAGFVGARIRRKK